MKVAVMGAGAVGSYFGARLHQAGHEVVLIARGATVDAVRERGLHLQMQGFDDYLPMAVSADVSACRDAAMVLFCVKSQDTTAAGAAMRPFLRNDSTVLCLQNGVDNAERLSEVLGFPAVPVAVYVAVESPGPGHVRHNGRGKLIMGPSVGSEAVMQAFAQAGIPVRVTAEVMTALWAKLTANCAYNALSALTQVPYGELVRCTGIEATMRGLVTECRAVAAAEGHVLPDAIWDEVFSLSQSMPDQRSSTAQDMARGRATEIDFINGHVVRCADRHGIDAPLNRLLHALVKIRERQEDGSRTGGVARPP